ncbi:hypothetical protein POZ87_18450 [Cupriavidus taiwanensis]
MRLGQEVQAVPRQAQLN